MAGQIAPGSPHDLAGSPARCPFSPNFIGSCWVPLLKHNMLQTKRVPISSNPSNLEDLD